MIIGTCWYLAGLSLLVSLVGSAITVVPGHDAFTAGIIAGGLSGSILFAAVAVLLHTREWPWIRQSKLVRNLFLGFAALATLCLLLIVG
jgi:hypothetical protein